MNVAKLCFLTKYDFRYFYSFDRKKDMVVWTLSIKTELSKGIDLNNKHPSLSADKTP